MGIRARIEAVRALKAADRELEAADQTATSDADPAWAAANRKVNAAELNPDLPRCYLDPHDR